MKQVNALEVCEKAIEVYGTTSQMRKTIEECLELSLALAHYLDKKVSIEDVVDEIADVSIMLMQLRLVFGDAEINAQMFKKIERLELMLTAGGCDARDH